MSKPRFQIISLVNLKKYKTFGSSIVTPEEYKRRCAVYFVSEHFVVLFLTMGHKYLNQEPPLQKRYLQMVAKIIPENIKNATGPRSAVARGRRT